jgi:hypothetical protein
LAHALARPDCSKTPNGFATSIDDPAVRAGPSRRRIVRLPGYLAITGLVAADSLKQDVGVAGLGYFAEAHQVVSGQL